MYAIDVKTWLESLLRYITELNEDNDVIYNAIIVLNTHIYANLSNDEKKIIFHIASFLNPCIWTHLGYLTIGYMVILYMESIKY